MQSIKVCLVEDNAEVREGMINLLGSDGRFEMLAAYNNAEIALEELPAWNAEIVIMDINLPGMSGIDCLKKTKKDCPHSQFIMFTIYENDEKVFEALEAGASGYLLKKTPLFKITDALIELHEGGAPMSTQIARKVIERLHTRTEDQTALLSPRENEILLLLSKGLLYKEIGASLNISANTAKKHVMNIYQKLHINSRAQAMHLAFDKGFL